MPQALTEVVARPPVVGPVMSHVEKFARELADSLQLTRPLEVDRAVHWLLLFLLVCGAAVVRFWGLGSVGLHGDEETMGMAVRGIIHQGVPVLPSGMFYPRGMSQLYLMAASVAIFGESEWALRLPSVLCGIALVPIGYIVGRRFLRPNWNLAFAASLAFLPELIVYSQTARMYIFLVTCIALSMACVFAWERSNHLRWLAAAAIALVPGLEMHALAIASVLMLLFPGIVQGDLRKIGAAAVAMVGVFVAYFLIDRFVNAQYPTPPADFVKQFDLTAEGGSDVVHGVSMNFRIVLWAAGLGLAYFAIRIARSATSAGASIAVGGLLLAALALQLALLYHLAALCYAAGLVLAAGHGALGSRANPVIFAAGVAAIAVGHALLVAPAAGTVVRTVGAMIGQPSVWPYARVAEFSFAASLLCGALFAWGLLRLACRRTAPDFWMIAVLGLWAPVFALGLFAWDVPSRYTSMSLLPMLLCAFALVQLGIDRIVRLQAEARGFIERAAAVIAAICVVNPVHAAATINSGYRTHPDHKGAAEFIRQQHVTDDDVLIAEDVLQQTYYLGQVDYWLIGPGVARRFVMQAEDGVVDFYTATPLIVTTQTLDKVLAANRGKRVFVIGSGEGWVRGRRTVRGELTAALESPRFKTVYVGRDGLTRVLQAVPEAILPTAPAGSTSAAEVSSGEKTLPVPADAPVEPLAPAPAVRK